MTRLRYPRYYHGNVIEIHGSTAVMVLRLDGIPAVVGTTSTGVPWEWRLPLPEWYIILGAQSTLMFLYGLNNLTYRA